MKTKTIKTLFAPSIRSRHPSHNNLRTKLPHKSKRAIVRLGSTFVSRFPANSLVEINSVQAVQTSSDKLLMKLAFTKGKTRTAVWFTLSKDGKSAISQNPDNLGKSVNFADLPYPIVIKSRLGSRNRGNFLLNKQSELETFLKNRGSFDRYIIEKFYNFNREYRLHVTKNGCFYTCRKVLKSDTPDKERWYRNDSNSSWLLETNANFDKPVNWKEIEAECVKALTSVGLDIGACDVRVQSTKDQKGVTRKNPDFIIIEINSAPAFGDLTETHYINTINNLIDTKINESKNS